jgi:hypothetical protein
VTAVRTRGVAPPDGDSEPVVYDADPRLDQGQLDAPRAVLLRGRLIR